MVYWDYYSLDSYNYCKKIKLHTSAGFDPWVAGGIWTWNRFFTAIPYSLEASNACLQACKTNKVENVFAVLWGDDSSECDLYSAFPVIILYGNHTYKSVIGEDPEPLRVRFEGLCGGHLYDWIYATNIDGSLPFSNNVRFPKNMSKWLLWQDPLYSFWCIQCKDIDLQSHYKKICHSLKIAINRNSNVYTLNYRLIFPYLMAKVLSIKCVLRDKLTAAYHSENPKRELELARKNYIIKLSQALDKLWKFHRDLIWLSTFKPFGLEILEMRYGAIRTRLESISDRIVSICSADSKMMDIDESIEYIGPLSNTTISKDQKVESTESDDDSALLNVTLKPQSVYNSMPELDEDIFEPYPKSGSELILDFTRAYTPARMSWTT